jgi:hypothetical protein
MDNIRKNNAFITNQFLLLLPSKKMTFSAIICLAILFYYFNDYGTAQEQKQTQAIIAQPKINDIYFLDFRLLNVDLRPTEKYRLAKVVDITGDIITLVYGSFYYQRQHATINAIYYGQLSYKDYFEPRRYDFTKDQIQQKLDSGVIYLAKRPERKKLYGQLVGPEIPSYRTNAMTLGKKENIKGEAYAQALNVEKSVEMSFQQFKESAELGYAPGQVNLAQMYINGQFVEKNYINALYWLKQASLQSHKAAILKYEIICKQVDGCVLYDFYQQLVASGVNIKVRSLDFKLAQ